MGAADHLTDRERRYLLAAFKAAPTFLRTFDSPKLSKPMGWDVFEGEDVLQVLIDYDYCKRQGYEVTLTPAGREVGRELQDEEIVLSDVEQAYLLAMLEAHIKKMAFSRTNVTCPTLTIPTKLAAEIGTRFLDDGLAKAVTLNTIELTEKGLTEAKHQRAVTKAAKQELNRMQLTEIQKRLLVIVIRAGGELHARAQTPEGFSQREVEENFSALEQMGLIFRTSVYYKLTPQGRLIAKELNAEGSVVSQATTGAHAPSRTTLVNLSPLPPESHIISIGVPPVAATKTPSRFAAFNWIPPRIRFLMAASAMYPQFNLGANEKKDVADSLGFSEVEAENVLDSLNAFVFNASPTKWDKTKAQIQVEFEFDRLPGENPDEQELFLCAYAKHPDGAFDCAEIANECGLPLIVYEAISRFGRGGQWKFIINTNVEFTNEGRRVAAELLAEKEKLRESAWQMSELQQIIAVAVFQYKIPEPDFPVPMQCVCSTTIATVAADLGMEEGAVLELIKPLHDRFYFQMSDRPEGTQVGLAKAKETQIRRIEERFIREANTLTHGERGMCLVSVVPQQLDESKSWSDVISNSLLIRPEVGPAVEYCPDFGASR